MTQAVGAVIRKIVTVVEETHLEMGMTIAPPTRRAAAIAVIENPFAGRYVEDLSPLIAIGEELGDLLAKRAVAALGIDGAKAHSYGKAAAVGENGELEHAAAILHPKMGAPVRKALGKGAALIPSSKKRSGPGTTLDIPLGHKDAAFVRSHFDGMEVQINDAPRANEIMVALAVTDGGRPLPRVGGLTVGEVKGGDGVREILLDQRWREACNEATVYWARHWPSPSRGWRRARLLRLARSRSVRSTATRC